MPHICWGYFEKRGIGLNTKLKAPERGIFFGPGKWIKYVNQLDLMVDNGIYGVSVYSSTVAACAMHLSNSAFEYQWSEVFLQLYYTLII